MWPGSNKKELKRNRISRNEKKIEKNWKKVQIEKGNESPNRKGKQKSKERRDIKVQIEYGK